MRQRVRINGVVVDKVLIQLVGIQKTQLTLGTLAHRPTLARGPILVLALALLAAMVMPSAGAQARDPLRDRQWHLDMVRAEEAWSANRGKGITVAVVDTGVDASHPDLAGRMVSGIDLVNPGTPPHDENGHGTLVAGIIGAVAGNGIGVYGAAPEVKLMSVRVLDAKGDGTSAKVAEGVRWAVDHGARVINLSLAEVPSIFSSLGAILGSELENAITYAAEKGAVVVAAAGNQGGSSTPYRQSLPALVVGASDQNDKVWAQSNRDSNTVFAPGVGIISTWKDHGYGEGNGTSFATPIVSAAAAILLTQGLNEEDTRNRITGTGKRITSEGRGRRLDMAAAAGFPGPPQSPRPTISSSPEPTSAPTPTATASPSPASSGQNPAGTPAPGPQASAGQSPGGDPEATLAPDAINTIRPVSEDDAIPVEPDGGIGDGAGPPDEPPGDDSPLPGLSRWLGLLVIAGLVWAFIRAARIR